MFGYLSPILPYFSSIFSMFSASTGASVPYSQILREFKTKHKAFELSRNQSIFQNVSFGELMTANRCIFVYFHNASSSNCARFAENILSSESVIDYLRVNMQCWIGDDRNQEGLRLFRQITHQWNERRRPFVCVAGIHPQSRKLVLVHRQYVGNVPNPAHFIGNVLDHGMQRWQQFEAQQIALQQQSQSDRYLREMQDREYQQALAAARDDDDGDAVSVQSHEADPVPSNPSLSEHAAAPLPQTEKYENRMREAKERHNELCAKLADCPKEQSVKIALRLPNGSRVQQSFDRCQCRIEDLFNFAQCHELMIDGKHIDDFDLVSSYPRKVFTADQGELTLEEAGISATSMVLFCSVVDE